MKARAINRAAQQLHQYIKARAGFEGVGYQLSVPFFVNTLVQGYRMRFGVEFDEKTGDANHGFSGDVILAIDIPVVVFDQFEEVESDDVDIGLEMRTGRALTPASVLNRYDPARVYAHRYAGDSRRDLLEASRDAEAAGDRQHASVPRAAMRFMDTIG